MSHWRRTRMISFRVSEREFEMLKSVSESEGARSVSDFARDALCGQKSGATGDAAGALLELRAELEQLKTYVRRVAELLEDPRERRPANEDPRERRPANEDRREPRPANNDDRHQPRPANGSDDRREPRAAASVHERPLAAAANGRQPGRL